MANENENFVLVVNSDGKVVSKAYQDTHVVGDLASSDVSKPSSASEVVIDYKEVKPPEESKKKH